MYVCMYEVWMNESINGRRARESRERDRRRDFFAVMQSIGSLPEYRKFVSAVPVRL